MAPAISPVALADSIHWMSSLTFLPAYLDPGAGSIMLQVIIAGLFSLGVVLKLYWHRVIAFLGLQSKHVEADEAVPDRDQEPSSHIVHEQTA